VLVVVAEIARHNRELHPRASAGGVGHAADRVRVYVAHGLVEGLRAKRFMRSPQTKERGRRAQELEPGWRHLVGKLGVGQLGEEGERPAARRAASPGREGPDGTHRVRRARRRGGHAQALPPGEPDRLVERAAAGGLAGGARRSHESREGGQCQGDEDSVAHELVLPPACEAMVSPQ
jgi:hypothetical protein